MASLNRRLSIAPMMDWTDRHCRAFHRALTVKALLYTEMITAPAVVHGDQQRLLGFDDVEHPVALQLGGSDPGQLAEAARIGQAFGYDEINLNVGCPSDRVQSGRFGACLMREPSLVADCMAAIKEAVSVPATVKCRIGVDDQDPQVSLFATVDACAAVGIEVFIIHARMAWLQGLSPKENRDVPPLDYALVRRLKRERPHLSVSVNGGIASLAEAETHLDDSDGVRLDGVMLGRAAYHEPAILGQADRRLFGGATSDVDAFAAIDRYRPYLAARLEEGVHLPAMTRHMLGLMHGRPGARAYRRILTVDSIAPGAGLEVVDRAVDAVREAEARLELRGEAA
ncbi:tRNA dihydrouridine(20/20a) synthase DusA [Brevundimonas sp.]|uniref:tRNA dihydrouridine(20/20a) synthase DusA n=1 Tax=Brevundimonas sp. TaxID=1871086 RepID=UPI00272FE9D5|nr:tRNA dihydrouridine(20/20a) synthase DusA [Brevundimonas sp.]MDP1912989.1 tRNA dihydrouridine(20/20a) synthase DusA [Brevundimonas sp.]